MLHDLWYANPNKCDIKIKTKTKCRQHSCLHISIANPLIPCRFPKPILVIIQKTLTYWLPILQCTFTNKIIIIRGVKCNDYVTPNYKTCLTYLLLYKLCWCMYESLSSYSCSFFLYNVQFILLLKCTCIESLINLTTPRRRWIIKCLCYTIDWPKATMWLTKNIVYIGHDVRAFICTLWSIRKLMRI